MRVLGEKLRAQLFPLWMIWQATHHIDGLVGVGPLESLDLGPPSALLLRGHGVYAWGASVEEAERVVEARWSDRSYRRAASSPITADSGVCFPRVMIRKPPSGKYRLYSRKVDPGTKRRKNLGTFATRAAAEKHERAVQFFKRG